MATQGSVQGAQLAQYPASSFDVAAWANGSEHPCTEYMVPDYAPFYLWHTATLLQTEGVENYWVINGWDNVPTFQRLPEGYASVPHASPEGLCIDQWYTLYTVVVFRGVV
jgi:hypothetical protein